MSMHGMIDDLIRRQSLVEVQPILGGRRIRRVLCPPEVLAELDPDTSRVIDAANAGQLRAWIDGFIAGRRITVGSGGDRDVDLKILSPPPDEVWELRKRERPSTRIFGRFAMKDVFIATNIRTAEDLFALEWLSGDRVKWPVWRQEIRRCKAVWRSHFLDYQPVSGGRLDDYISNAIDARSG